MQSLFNTCFWCPFLDPHLTTYHENIGVQTIAFGRNRHIYHVHFTDFALQLLIMSEIHVTTIVHRCCSRIIAENGEDTEQSLVL